MASKGEMQLKEDAPLFSRPSSPEKEKKYVNTLEDIPEAIPGPNAFAQQVARMDRHRLEGNAFYQQEVQKRKATPPTALHPAMRPRSNSDPPTSPRESVCTTFSPFINAGKLQKHDSSPLRLVPSDADMAVPTLRGMIEERQEQMQHERSGAPTDRTPVFIPTPKIACNDFAKPTATPNKRGDGETVQRDPPPSKTPKKGFFGRLKLSTNLRGAASPAPNLLDDSVKAERDENVPVKAQAVLGTSSPPKVRKSLGSSTSRTNLPRSPSKRKGFFFRKPADVDDPAAIAVTEPKSAEIAPPTASSYVKTPPTAFSDPTHYSYNYQNKRIISQSNSDKGAANEKKGQTHAVTRSQSLKYFDHTMPPTPPAKNTPPEEKARKFTPMPKSASKLPFYDEQTTPSKGPEGMVSISGRVSPTRFGSYGHKDVPRLVTKPSVYSLRASVVPNLSDEDTFGEMKARIDGLGLEGFNMPAENVRSSKLLEVYSPSMYSSDLNGRPSSVLINGAPPGDHAAKSPNAQSTHTKESSSSAGEIPIVYPELEKDPSIPKMPTFAGIHYHKLNQSDTQLTIRKPHHGYTHSLDHSVTNSPQPSVDSSLFALPLDRMKRPDSPTSFKHLSAAPSPLHLPATTFKPPPRSTSKLGVIGRGRPEVKIVDIKKSTTGGVLVQNHVRRTSASPSKRNDVFDNAPSLPARTASYGTRSPSPRDSGVESTREQEPDVDPQKPSPKRDRPGDKFDRMIEILNKLNARNDEMSTMREELRATNERLDQRLAAVENLHRASPAPSYALDESIMNEKSESDSYSIRVPTEVARDFYRAGEEHEGSENTIAQDVTESDTIAELKETNRRLLEMVGGFAEKIEALEKRTATQG